MALTIYTISDPVLAGSALTSMAMFFGQESWVASLVKTGLMLSLLLILAQTVVQKGLRLDVILIQLIVVWAMFTPKTTVQIEQFDNTAPPRVVDNVPYAIAYPAALAGTFSLFMTQKIEQVMSSVNGDYLSVSGDVHPFAPARILLSFAKCPAEPLGCLPQNLVETLRLATRYCAGPNMARARFAESNAVLTDLASTLTESGSTVIYDEANPFMPGGGGGRPASCSEVASYLRNYEQYISNSSGTNEITESLTSLASNANIRNTKSMILADGRVNYDAALGMVNKVTGADANIDTQSMLNMMTYAVADSLKYEASTPIDQPLSIRRDSGLYDWAKTEAAQSMLVSTTAPKFMDVLFFVFIASTPFVLFVVVANPQSGMKVAASYVLFGLWTQSWIPMMAIITSWYQRDILSMPAPKLNAPLSAEYMAALMRQVMTSTIAAGNMIQNAPYLMFAILSGSMFAMSNMISKAVPSGSGSLSTEGGGGKGSAGGGGGIIGGTGPGSPALGQSSAVIGADNAVRSGMTSDGVGPRGDVGANLPGLASVSGGAEVGAASSYANEKSAAARKKLESQAAAAIAEVNSLVTSGGLDKRGGELATYLNNRGYKAEYNESDGTMTVNGQKFGLVTGQGSASRTSAGGKGQVAARADLAQLLPSLGGVAIGQGPAGLVAGKAASVALNAAGIQLQGDIAAFVAQTHDNSQTATLSAENTKGTSNSRGTTRTAGTSNGNTAQTGTTAQSGGTWSNTGQRAKQLSETLSRLASMTQDLNDADKRTKTATNSSGVQANTQIAGKDVVSGWADNAIKKNGQVSPNEFKALEKVTDAVGPSLTPAQMSQFQQLSAANYKELEQSFGSALNKDQLAGAAAWKALTTMSNSPGGSSDDKIRAMEGMATMASRAGMGSEMSNALQAAREAIKISDNVNANLASMENVVAPAALDARDKATAGLSDKSLAQHKGQVAAKIAQGEAKAEGALTEARNEYTSQPFKGNEGIQSFNADNPVKQPDYQKLVAGFEQSTENQTGMFVRPKEAGGYVATNNPETRNVPYDAANGPNSVPQVMTPSGSQTPSPAQSPEPSKSPQTISGLIDAAANIGGSSVGGLMGVLNKGTDSGADASSPIATFFTQGGGNSGAPTAGSPGGGSGSGSAGAGLPQLGNPGGQVNAGGGRMMVEPSQPNSQETTGKPNSKSAPPGNNGSPSRSIPGTK